MTTFCFGVYLLISPCCTYTRITSITGLQRCYKQLSCGAKIFIVWNLSKSSKRQQRELFFLQQFSYFGYIYNIQHLVHLGVSSDLPPVADISRGILRRDIITGYVNKLQFQYLTETIRSADANLNYRSQFWKGLKWSTQSPLATFSLILKNDLKVM